MSLEENKNIVRQLIEAHNQNDIAKFREFFSPDFIAHIADWPHPLNRDEYVQGVKIARQAFSNLVFTIQDIIAEGDKVVSRIVAQGKHTGEYLGVAPTGEQIKFSGVTIRQIINGKVIEEWQVNDQYSLLKQLKR